MFWQCNFVQFFQMFCGSIATMLPQMCHGAVKYRIYNAAKVNEITVSQIYVFKSLWRHRFTWHLHTSVNAYVIGFLCTAVRECMITEHPCVCVCVCVCACVSACMCMCLCLHVCVCGFCRPPWLMSSGTSDQVCHKSFCPVYTGVKTTPGWMGWEDEGVTWGGVCCSVGHCV